MARTAKTTLKLQNAGVPLGSSFDTLNLNVGISGLDSGSGIAELDAIGAAFSGVQEKSITVPDGILIAFSFTHAPKLIYWNGALQTVADDYTVSSNTITFTAAAGVPQTGDKIINVYG